MASMMELCIYVENTNQTGTKSVADKLKQLYRTTFVLATVYFFIMICFVTLLAIKDMQSWLKTSYGVTTSIVFILDSIGLLYTTRLLILTLRRDFGDSMKAETHNLTWLFVVFTISYLFRTLLLAPEGHWSSIQHYFNPDSSPQHQYYIRMVLYTVSFLLWDILPIFLQLLMHHKNFKPNKKSEEDLLDANASLNSDQCDHDIIGCSNQVHAAEAFQNEELNLFDLNGQQKRCYSQGAQNYSVAAKLGTIKPDHHDASANGS